MKDEEGVDRMRECYAMGHDVDFGTGRNLVVYNCVPEEKTLRILCRVWRADFNEVWLGVQYQLGIERAAARMLAERGKA